MVAEIKNPMGETGKGAGEAVPETSRDRTTGTAQDLVADEALILVRYRTEITAEAEVREGEMATTTTPPPPPKGCTENAGQRSELSGWR